MHSSAPVKYGNDGPPHVRMPLHWLPNSVCMKTPCMLDRPGWRRLIWMILSSSTPKTATFMLPSRMAFLGTWRHERSLEMRRIWMEYKRFGMILTNRCVLLVTRCSSQTRGSQQSTRQKLRRRGQRRGTPWRPCSVEYWTKETFLARACRYGQFPELNPIDLFSCVDGCTRQHPLAFGQVRYCSGCSRAKQS
jgi:hypothetical protein